MTASDLAKKCWSKDFSCIDYDQADPEILEKFLERRKCVYLKKGNGEDAKFYVATQMDLLKFMVKA